jgi:hypothetical protein
MQIPFPEQSQSDSLQSTPLNPCLQMHKPASHVPLPLQLFKHDLSAQSEPFQPG